MNSVLSMAEFIYTHPELKFLKPQVWKIHYRLEQGQESGLSCFQVLKQHSTLVSARPIGQDNGYSLYGSAQISEKQVATDKETNKSKLEQIKKMIDELSSLAKDLNI